MWEARQDLIEEQVLPGRAAGALSRFIELINALEDDTIELRLHEQTESRDQIVGLVCDVRARERREVEGTY